MHNLIYCAWFRILIKCKRQKIVSIQMFCIHFYYMQLECLHFFLRWDQYSTVPCNASPKCASMSSTDYSSQNSFFPTLQAIIILAHFKFMLIIISFSFHPYLLTAHKLYFFQSRLQRTNTKDI